jgi:hypothetical protein
MTDMLTPIIYVFIDESLSYFAYCSLMTRYMSSLFDKDQTEINHRLYLFNLIFQSIDYELWKKINLNEEDYLFVYRWLLLDCKREFHCFDHVIRVLELVWIYSIPYNYSCLQSIINDRSLFTVFLCISFSSSSSSRSHRSTKRILQRAQIYYSNYTSSHK